MAFQTSFLRDGEWVTETVNFQSALRQATVAAAPAPALERHPEPPSCGILSRTVIESPIVHRVLPVRLRSKTHNDIAFIGERFVQISELRRDGQVHEVAQKSDFGSRIRSVVVLGDALEHGLDDENPGNFAKSEDVDLPMPDASDALRGLEGRSLPPQLLVLILESGDVVFLFLREQPNAPPEFVLNTYNLPRKIPYLGHYLVIDPSSRYMTAASPEGVLVVFELEEMTTLNAQYVSRGSFSPVKSARLRLIQGVIHKLEFLHPRPEDDYHVILILIVIRRERSRGEPVTRMVIYEWEVGDNLKDVFAGDKTGNRLPQEHKMPLLLIPLRFSTAFFTVSEEFIGIVKHCLSGSPVFESLCADPPSQTRLHHGAHNPLWTAWARPFRRQKYFEKTDIIYLAREDGAIIHIEIEAMDLVPSVTNVGCLDTNINTAFTTAYDIFSDILIIGGDSGPGGIWKLAPRTDLEQVSILPNWSPVVDVATSSWSPAGSAAPTRRQGAGAGAGRMSPDKPLTRPDTVFTASGRGSKGSVTQWRWGIQGRVGLDIDFGEPIRHSWAFALAGPGGGCGLSALLALPCSSAMLQFSEDFGQVNALAAEDTPFDLTSRTLDVCSSPQGTVIQVSERAVIVTTGFQSSRVSLSEVLALDDAVAGNACCADDTIILSTHGEKNSRLHTLLATPAGIQRDSTWETKGDVTCVSLSLGSESRFVVAGSVVDGTPWISVFSLTGETIAAKAMTKQHGPATDMDGPDACVQLESLTSICLVHRNAAGDAYFVAGTRCGHLLSIRITEQDAERIAWTAETIGLAPAEVFPASEPFNGTAAVLLCCDNALIMMTELSPYDGKFHGKNFVWLTDANDASMPSPPVHSASTLRHNISGSPGHMSLMAQTGSRLLVAEVWPHVGLVPRSISVEGTPTRIIYSQTWSCLVVALLRGDRPTLAFIDPESGETISVPSDKDGTALDFIAGLGHPGDRIYCLHEWLYVKDGKTFCFILVTTKDGRLLIVSVNKPKIRVGERRLSRLLYWTRYKKVLGLPIYSVVGDDQGIVFCVDRTIRWEVLDLAEKKLRLMNEYELDSPATSLSVERGHLLALTTLHSLEVIDYKNKRSGGMVLIHSDRVSRRTIHMIDAGDATDGRGGWPVTLLSDQTGSIAGIRVPWWQRGKEFDVVFEGMLPTSVRRFVGTRSRPLWAFDGRRACYGTVAGTQDCADILGISLDGSLQHFTLLGADLWRFLCLVQNMVRRSAEAESGAFGDDDENADGGLEPRQHPKRMHIDGDVLELCLRRRTLEKMAGKGNGFVLFRQYLDRLEGGRHTRGLGDGAVSEQERDEGYMRLGYKILEHLLAPVL